ncbi:MAG TPA: DUF3892 domain-containing protein [Puia sp.]|nr:DUF3892 domain-containing protein [Puia sp.]
MSREIMCINKANRDSQYEHIENVGGVVSGVRWKKSQGQVIREIENKLETYYVTENGKTVSVIVAVSAAGNKYIKTETDLVRPDNLLSLPECS